MASCFFGFPTARWAFVFFLLCPWTNQNRPWQSRVTHTRTSDPPNIVLSEREREREGIQRRRKKRSRVTFKRIPAGFSCLYRWRAAAVDVSPVGWLLKVDHLVSFLHPLPICMEQSVLSVTKPAPWASSPGGLSGLQLIPRNHHEDHRGDRGLGRRGLQHVHDLRGKQPLSAHHRARPLTNRVRGVKVWPGVPQVLLWNFEGGWSGKCWSDHRWLSFSEMCSIMGECKSNGDASLVENNDPIIFLPCNPGMGLLKMWNNVRSQYGKSCWVVTSQWTEVHQN